MLMLSFLGLSHSDDVILNMATIYILKKFFITQKPKYFTHIQFKSQGTRKCTKNIRTVGMQ